MLNSTPLEWLNENSVRAYPLTADSTRYLTKGVTTYDLYTIIVDAAFVFSSITDPVQLTKVATSSSNLVFTVTSGTTNLTFTITNYVSASYPQYVRDSNHNLLVVGGAAITIPVSTSFYLVNTSFESCVSQEIVANTLGLSTLTIAGTPLTGSITIGEGYQVALIPGSNSIDIEVGRNEGVPLPCGNVRGVDFDCNSIVSSVNGVTPNKTGNPIFFTGKNHVIIYDSPDDNRIYIGYDFVTADVPVQKLTTPNSVI